MPYWRLFYHVVWATRDREALIGSAAEAIIARSLRSTCNTLNVLPHGIGMLPDHIHIAISIPPSLAIATAVGRLKAAASHAVTEAEVLGEAAFGWQREYGVLSFGEKALEDVVAYVTYQRERHAAHNLWPTLERVDNHR